MVDRKVPVRLVIADSDSSDRKLLTQAVERVRAFELVASVSNLSFLKHTLRCEPIDVVLLDVELLRERGTEALTELYELYSRLVVALITDDGKDSIETTLSSLEIGAIDFIPKPSREDEVAFVSRVQVYLEKWLTTLKLPRGEESTQQNLLKESVAKKDVQPKLVLPENHRFDLVVMGSSTGGPQLLIDLIPQLPKRLGCPILLVQHMPAQFTRSLAEHLTAVSEIKVCEAKEGDLMEPNVVYVAPGDYHLVLKPDPRNLGMYRFELNEDPLCNGCRPSLDVLFKSLETHFKGAILSVVLTGMGEDGANGIAQLKQKKLCYCLAQDKASCVVYGMPRAVAERGLADEVLSGGSIPSRVAELTRGDSEGD